MEQSANAFWVKCGQVTRADQLRLYRERPNASDNTDFLLFLFQNKGIVQVYGNQFSAVPYSCLLLPFAEPQLTAYFNIPIKWVHLQIKPEFLHTLRKNGFKTGEVQLLANPVAVSNIWEIMRPLYENRNYFDSLTRTHAAGLLLGLLRNDAEMVTTAAKVPHFDKLTALRSEIYKHPERSWYIEDICEWLCISRPYFHKIYKSAFQVSCTQDVIMSRIAYAKRLLEQTEVSVSEVSQQVGFDTEVYFMRQFKRHTGMTPTAYRRVCRQERNHKGEIKKNLGK